MGSKLQQSWMSSLNFAGRWNNWNDFLLLWSFSSRGYPESISVKTTPREVAEVSDIIISGKLYHHRNKNIYYSHISSIKRFMKKQASSIDLQRSFIQCSSNHLTLSSLLRITEASSCQGDVWGPRWATGWDGTRQGVKNWSLDQRNVTFHYYCIGLDRSLHHRSRAEQGKLKF